MVPAWVSIIQSSTVLRVSHVASPFQSFFVDAGSHLRGLSSSTSGRNTRSSECGSARLVRSRVKRSPWDSPRKSSTCTSQLLSGNQCVARQAWRCCYWRDTEVFSNGSVAASVLES